MPFHPFLEKGSPTKIEYGKTLVPLFQHLGSPRPLEGPLPKGSERSHRRSAKPPAFGSAGKAEGGSEAEFREPIDVDGS